MAIYKIKDDINTVSKKPYVTYNKVMEEELSEALFVGDIDDSDDEEQTVFDRRRKGAYAD